MLLKLAINASTLIFPAIMIHLSKHQPDNTIINSADPLSFYREPALYISTDSLTDQSVQPKAQCDTSTISNPRLHISYMLRRFSNLEYTHQLIEKTMKHSSHAKTSKRPLLLLPRDLFGFFHLLAEQSPRILLADLLYNTENLAVHFPCINLKQVVTQKCLHGHLMDAPGVQVANSVLNQGLMTLVLLSTFALSVAENPVVMPGFQRILPGAQGKDEGVVKRVFGEVFKSFCLFFDRVEVLAACLARLEEGLDLKEEFRVYEQIFNCDERKYFLVMKCVWSYIRFRFTPFKGTH